MIHCGETNEHVSIPHATCDVEQSITGLFEQVALRSPRRTALSTSTLTLTYEALNGVANNVAHALLGMKADVAQPVGLLLDQDVRTVHTILGVLKAGRFYVPLDPAYPDDRLSSVLRDCRPGIVITERRYFSRARALAPRGCQVVLLEDLHIGSRCDNPGLLVSPGDLAAVFYTSGSTGRPKGVMQTHRLVLHRVKVDTSAFRISSDDRLSLLSSPGYSVSLRHLFGGLLNGAVVCPFDVARNGLTELGAWLERERVTLYFSVPAVFRELSDSVAGPETFRHLRVLHLSGERVTSDDVDRYRSLCPPKCVFANSLASNETGVFRMFVGGKETQAYEGTAPVGFAVADKEILILDDNGTPAGPNQVGEIAVRSEFLSPGYWGQPELTASMFKLDPHAMGKRIYHTGDRGRLLPDGCLLYEGRKDFRVKIRGIRVELGDVEAALRLHPSVDHAVVIAGEDSPGDPRLMAYVVFVHGAAATSSELRSFLSDRLPAHMVPTTVMVLEKLPLTPHGKVDRQALPAPDDCRPGHTTRFVAPDDDLERQLASICESILGVHPVGLEDNLFDLGLDSLKALRLIEQCERRLGSHLPPATLFASPTLAQLAVAVRESSVRETWSSLLPIQPEGDRPPFFWIHGDCSNPCLSRFLGPDQPFYALEHQSQDGRPARYSEVATIAGYYIQEMRKVQRTGPYYVGGYSFGGIVALEVAQQLTHKGEHVGLLALLDPPSLLTARKGAVPPTQTQTQTQPTLSALSRHSESLAVLTPAEQLAYLRVRAIPKTAHILKLPALEVMIERLIYRFQLALGLRLSVFVRGCYIRDIYTATFGRYVARPYQGRVLLFKGEDRVYQSSQDWEQLLGHDCEVHIVPAGHTEMRDERCLPLWANRLDAALSAAQRDSSGDRVARPNCGGDSREGVSASWERARVATSRRQPPSAPRALPNRALTQRS